ncbi:hypothetical protein BOX15_Mlig009050g1 [Macrostomum lignano]|uniref:RNA helicase n=1 Tax=Macrostomum lignano TaxID=282301 RepID=A0A267GTA5_9PLAT|nr:hypothetical protein BOX15_Mlig009050g1 [Macrostomum lignano]
MQPFRSGGGSSGGSFDPPPRKKFSAYNNPLAEEPDTAYGESYYSRYGNSSRNATTAPVAVVDYRKTPGVAPPAAASSGPSAASAPYAGIGRKRVQDEDDYFYGDEDDNEMEGNGDAGRAHDNDDEEDPLEAFMAGVTAEAKRDLDRIAPSLQQKQQSQQQQLQQQQQQQKGLREDLEREDEMEAYLKFMQENPNVGVQGDDEEIYEYDNEGNIVERAGHKEIDPLPPVDHSQVQYAPFERNFYTPHPEVAAMKPEQAMELRRKLGIRVQGVEAPYPICSFAHLGLDDQLMDSISRAGFTQPTPIQAQACPAALSGRDVIGIAKTGSGKTVTFVWPLVMHVLDQSPLAPGDGPIGLICAPTRELALQIYAEARKFGKPYGVTVVCAYGGGSMWEQQKACEAGCEILVCTPGRLIDLVKKKATNLRRVTYLVFDEADKMFQLGFEAQVRSIANHVRPDRQTLLFSATFKRRVERLVRDILTDPIRICQGELGEANQDVRQFVEIFRQPEDKWIWMQRHLAGFCSQGQTLVFVTRKANSEDVAKRISGAGFSCRLLHGDMHQSERNDTIAAYKRGEFQVLVATDVASRGLDIPAIRTVINYESARDIDTHTHRVGRTGRAGHKGMAYTLLLDKEKDFAGHLVRNLEGVGQEAPPRLLALANECAWFKNSRFKSGGQGKRVSASGRTRERPGLGLGGGGGGGGSGGGSGQEQQLSFTRPSSSGPQTDRVSATKQAFMSQYKKMFVSAGPDSGSGTSTLPSQQQQRPPQMPPPPPQSAPSSSNERRKRSRWD